MKPCFVLRLAEQMHLISAATKPDAPLSPQLYETTSLLHHLSTVMSKHAVNSILEHTGAPQTNDNFAIHIHQRWCSAKKLQNYLKGMHHLFVVVALLSY